MASRIPINLAAHPVEDVRRAQRVVRIAGVVVAVISAAHLLLWWSISQPGAESEVQAPVITPEQIEAWRAEVAALTAVADPSRARDAADAVAIGNELIGWRTIPWRAIFADLESVTPRRARLEIVAPTLGPGGQIDVQMTAAAIDTARLQDLIIGLEQHPSFADVWPQREDSGVDQFHRITLRARYVPSTRAEDPAEASR